MGGRAAGRARGAGTSRAPATDAATNRTCRAFVHYWLVENAAGRADAPTVVWQQGGPGGSSLIGLLTENGPLALSDFSFATAAYNATGVPTVFENAASWHRAPVLLTCWRVADGPRADGLLVLGPRLVRALRTPSCACRHTTQAARAAPF